MSEPVQQNPYAAPPPTDDFKPQPLPPIGSVLVQGWRLCGSRWTTMAAVIAIIWGPIELLSNFCEYEFSPTHEGLVILGTMALEFIGYPLGAAAIIAIAMAAAAGERISVAQSLGTSVRTFVKFSVTYFSCTLMILIGMVFLVVPGLYLMVVFSLVDSVVVREGKWGVSAMGRSFDLASQRVWALLGLCLMFGLLTTSPWIVYFLVELFVPIPEYWILDAAIDMSIDLIGAYPAVCFYLVYRQLAYRSDRVTSLPG